MHININSSTNTHDHINIILWYNHDQKQIRPNRRPKTSAAWVFFEDEGNFFTVKN